MKVLNTGVKIVTESNNELYKCQNMFESVNKNDNFVTESN